MTFIAWVLWILIWGLAGYFTVRVIMIRSEEKRRQEWLAAYLNQQRNMMRNTGRVVNVQLSSDPFEGLLKKD